MQVSINEMVKHALQEDIGDGDITAELLPTNLEAKAHIFTREAMVLCGQAWVNEVFAQLNSPIKINWFFQDGQHINTDQIICDLKGSARILLTGERSALNFLQLLSAVATKTSQYVQALQGTQAKLLDTRKTIPLWRLAEKYAVRCGGGHNHRMGLWDAFLIKENHIHAHGSITQVINAARKLYPEKTLEIEVENLVQLEEAIAAKPDIIMLDNFDLAQMKTAVELVNGRIKLEASGGINLQNIRAVAETGVDYISVGSLTKDVQAVDLSMRFF